MLLSSLNPLAVAQGDDLPDAVRIDGHTLSRSDIVGGAGALARRIAGARCVAVLAEPTAATVVAIDGGGFHRIVGRASTDLIKSGGYRIGAGEVETSLLGHPGVKEVAVVGLPDDDLGQRIVAFVVGPDADPDELIAHVASELSVHKRPREVRLVESLPRNAMGKVQKQRLALP